MNLLPLLLHIPRESGEKERSVSRPTSKPNTKNAKSTKAATELHRARQQEQAKKKKEEKQKQQEGKWAKQQQTKMAQGGGARKTVGSEKRAKSLVKRASKTKDRVLEEVYPPVWFED